MHYLFEKTKQLNLESSDNYNIIVGGEENSDQPYWNAIGNRQSREAFEQLKKIL